MAWDWERARQALNAPGSGDALAGPLAPQGAGVRPNGSRRRARRVVQEEDRAW